MNPISALLFSLVLWLVPWIGFAQTVAVMGVADSRVSQQQLKKVGKVIEVTLRERSSLRVISQEIFQEAWETVFRKILQEENSFAMDRYYRFRYREAEGILGGRDDLDALQLKGLLAFAEGDERRSEHYWVQLLQMNPAASLSRENFPPRLVDLFEGVKRRIGASARRDPAGLAIGSHLFFSEPFSPSWQQRFKRIAEETGSDFVMLYRLQPIGWNYKLSGSLFSVKEGEGRNPLIQSVEISSLQDLRQATKTLVKIMFFVDTSPNSK